MFLSMNNIIKGIFFLFAVAVMTETSVNAASPEDILGVWLTEGKDAKIEIYKCGDKYCGKIVWSKETNYPADSKDGTPGTPVLDRNNPKPKLRNVPLIGLQILYNFTYAGDNEWTGGKIYNPDNGRTYSAKMRLVSANQLKVRDYIGISLIGGTETWTK